MIKILIVEDHESNRELLGRRLRRRGFTVIAAADGLQGVACTLRERPDLVLMDIGLPGIDGWEATRLLKAEATTRDTPVIALTAHAMSGEREKALAAGCDEYETKPIEFERLLAKIVALTERAKAS